ncbi:DUF1491 family protein [Pseudohoeflea suaedae]|uniref:DUF1491 family protein n=1 Tax=Pseudohoeflea suaedae TaxID=877384 RepID=A0A4R5PP33_9HYPH|nr:DUF1491 family protein [Pseudohoeflea suaedae]TDH38830.1 DUF1491 family protein [Pseudohoeflea suaedae]
MSRLKSDIFVAALLRRMFAEGGTGAIERRGAPEAGAIHVRVRHRDGTETWLSPAPQSFFETGRPEERLFEIRKARVPEWDVGEALAREREFDPDIWIVEIETERPEDYLDIDNANR